MHAYFLWTKKEEKNEKYAGSLFDDDDSSAFDIAAALRCKCPLSSTFKPRHITNTSCFGNIVHSTSQQPVRI